MSHDGSKSTPSKSHSGKGDSECANRCGRSGTKRCAGCRSVAYCSTVCQREHWKEGGHKAACKAAQARLSAMGAGDTAKPVRAGAKGDGGSCIICLESDPQPIQSGCGCRGEAGLAHVSCRAQAASHRLYTTLKDDWWSVCGTCGQEFTGAMLTMLADTWWDSVRGRPEDDMLRILAAVRRAEARQHAGKYAESEAMLRQVIAGLKRVLGPDDPFTMSTTTKLANSLAYQHKFVDAAGIYRLVLSVHRRTYGFEHESTLLVTMNLAMTLSNLGRYTEAETMIREVQTVARRTLGSEHSQTLTMAASLASMLMTQGKAADAEKMYEEVLAVRRRVLGPEHPDTLTTASDLASTRGMQGKRAEAAAMLSEVVKVLARVLGPEHPDFLLASSKLAAFSKEPVQ